MYSHSTKIRVRYGETDQMGYMYYGNYAQYYEVGRVEMLRSLGMSYSSMEADGIMMPVLELKCKYIKPALYDQEITVKTIIKTLPGIRIFFEYELYNEKEELINIGATTLVFVDMKKNKPTNPPENFMEKLSVFFN
ncbi:thioesterase family protein [Pedobacter jeongneungensis]|jgi:acyl-CoA thioester hydrolase|uniref:Thioesterase n=4 Tax=Pedobacter TaxID=84567 RepID=A0A0T5VIB9_9SPHI|nr:MULTISPECIES: thioesterase family protein [Pedobacter]KRT13591.1 thioesterase [Pedobacter ginsenosidimutans]MDQ0639441.1 acyl-CoA thioester hydrolase [Pedobacter sp. W3I1]TBO42602.1 acyl-CoA thioesterase [Pedobacter kyonggii]